MVSFSRPSAGRERRNYTILDLEGEPEVIRERWFRSILDYRSWCYSSTDERFEFGDTFRRSARLPFRGRFFFYLKLGDKWLCLVIDGSTSYLIGFITSSVGGESGDNDLRVREMERADGKQFIEKSKLMHWDGSYKNAEAVKVGLESIKIAFLGMYRLVSGIVPRPARRERERWCDTLVIHFPEAGRFDSLLQCNIYKRFVVGGLVGDVPIVKAHKWSKDCMYLLDRCSEKVIEGKDKKWKVKRAGKSKGTMVPEEHTPNQCKKKGIGRSKGTKVPTASEDENCNDECNEERDERLLTALNDIRLFHRSDPVTGFVPLSSLPIQLHNGQAINPPTKELEQSDLTFLGASFGNISHDGCTYLDGQWVCKVPGSEKGSVRMMGQDASSSMELDMTSQVQNLSTEKHPDQDASPSMELGMTSHVQNVSYTQLKSGSTTEKHTVSKIGHVCPRAESVTANKVQVLPKAQLETLTTIRTEEQKDVVNGSIVKRRNCGLRNLGNTCYINATLQCLSTVPELKTSLTSYPADSRDTRVSQDCHNLTIAARDLFLQLAQSDGPIAPRHFIQMLRKGKSQFAEQLDNIYRQQDADECWSYLVTIFEQALGSELSGSAAIPLKELFGIELMKRNVNADSGEESVKSELIYSLHCYISEGVDHMTHGLLQVNSKTGDKFSPDGDADSSCNYESTIMELPRYLRVHFARLNWNNDLNQSGKILQKVEYPAIFDVKEYCSDELKEKLEATRETIRGLFNKGIHKDAAGSSSKAQELNGIYDLICVLTHEGKSADCGHYVAWIKNEGQWIKYDDENVILCQENEF